MGGSVIRSVPLVRPPEDPGELFVWMMLESVDEGLTGLLKANPVLMLPLLVLFQLVNGPDLRCVRCDYFRSQWHASSATARPPRMRRLSQP